MVRRRGQAAVEFLTTYSWAIFILFGVVSAIYMLDLADPDRYADPECVLDNQISCLEAQYQMGSGSDQLRLNLRNNYPQAVRVTDIRVELDTGTISSSGPLGGGSGVTIEPGSEQIITHTVNSPAWSDEGYVTEEVAATLDFRIDFEPVSSGNSYQKSGYTIVRAVPTS